MKGEFLNLPERTKKIREYGITHVLDSGTGIETVKDFLESNHPYIDIVKFGWGTSYIYPNIEKKIELYHNYNIKVSLGGTLLEGSYIQGKVEEFVAWAKDIGVDIVEVADGVFPLQPKEKALLIERMKKDFVVISEVGSKDVEVVMAPYKWVEYIKNDLKAGAWKVVLEGRESGTAGLYRANGEIRHGLIEEILQSIDIKNLIFEAPKKQQQVWFIKEFGANVNLGNIALDQVIPLETLRLGLRGDTMIYFFKKN